MRFTRVKSGSLVGNGAKKPRVPVHAGGHSHEVRIIGGAWKRTKLKVLDKPGLRPSPDRVRETLFNWLGQDLTGWHCLDAFAGTGALGWEAASRGAASVCLVEQSKALVAHLQATQRTLQAQSVTVVRGDGLAQLRQRATQPSLDLVFLDPPFDSDCYALALSLAAASLKPEGFIYLEARQEWQDEGLNQALQSQHQAADGAWRVLRH